MNLWIWHWTSGGYNSCRADTREEAIAKAKELARFTVLVVDEKTLHIGTEKELQKLDCLYR